MNATESICAAGEEPGRGGRRNERLPARAPGPGGTLSSPLRIAKDGTNYGIVLVETNALDASRILVKTSSGIKAWKKLP